MQSFNTYFTLSLTHTLITQVSLSVGLFVLEHFQLTRFVTGFNTILFSFLLFFPSILRKVLPARVQEQQGLRSAFITITTSSQHQSNGVSQDQERRSGICTFSFPSTMSQFFFYTICHNIWIESLCGSNNFTATAV